MIKIDDSLPLHQVAVQADSVDFGGDVIYTVEVRGWGDNGFDTGEAELLEIVVTNPCRHPPAVPADPLDQ